MIQALLGEGANPNLADNDEVGRNTPLHLAVEKNLLDVVEMFVENGCDLTLTNKYGYTGLHLAARAGLADMCSLLMSRGCDPNIPDRFGYTAAYWAK